MGKRRYRVTSRLRPGRGSAIGCSTSRASSISGWSNRTTTSPRPSASRLRAGSWRGLLADDPSSVLDRMRPLSATRSRRPLRRRRRASRCLGTGGDVEVGLFSSTSGPSDRDRPTKLDLRETEASKQPVGLELRPGVGAGEADHEARGIQAGLEHRLRHRRGTGSTDRRIREPLELHGPCERFGLARFLFAGVGTDLSLGLVARIEAFEGTGLPGRAHPRRRSSSRCRPRSGPPVGRSRGRRRSGRRRRALAIAPIASPPVPVRSGPRSSTAARAAVGSCPGGSRRDPSHRSRASPRSSRGSASRPRPAVSSDRIPAIGEGPACRRRPRPR